MKRYKIVSLFLIVTLPFAACGREPGVTVISVPVVTAPEKTIAPGVSVSRPENTAEPKKQYGVFEEPGGMPMTIPDLSETDKAKFDPGKVYEYLITSPYACHHYIINGAQKKEGKLYLTITDEVHFNEQTEATNLLINMFSLSEKNILELREFSGGSFDEGEFTMVKSIICSKMLNPIPVSENAYIEIENEETLETEQLTTLEFADSLLDGKSENNSLELYYMYFECSDNEITAIYQGSSGYEDWGEGSFGSNDPWCDDYDYKGDYEDEGGYED